MISKKKFSRGGQSFLALVLLIGAIISISVLLVAFLASTLVDTGYGYAASSNAQFLAMSGIQDALLQLDRNAAFASSGYTVNVGNYSANVTVMQNDPSAGFVTIISSATVQLHKRTVEVVAIEDAQTSSVTVLSVQNI